MEKDNDLHKLMNRIAISVAIFIVATIVIQFCKNNPPNKVLFGETTVRVYDTLHVRTQESLDHKIIVGYVIKISPQNMSEKHIIDFEKNDREYFNRQIFLRVEDNVKFIASRKIRFEEIDSIPVVAKRFMEISSKTISNESFKTIDGTNGLIVISVECHMQYNSVLLRFIK